MFAPALLETLTAVIETGSFERAAARLGVTPPAISQRMRTLTEAAGGPVLTRTRPAEATPLGLRLLRHARDVAALQADLAADLGATAGPRPVTVAINADSLETWAVDALADAPGFRFDVVVLDQDHTADALRRGEVSAAVTSEARAITGCLAHPLGALRYRATCTPDFRDRYFADGVTAAAIAAAPVLQFTSMDALQHRWLASHAPGRPPPAHRIPAPGPFTDATRAGLGWGLNPEVAVAGDLASGRLVEMIADTPLDTPLHWQVGRAMAEVLSPLTRAMRRAARAALIRSDG
ncbi:ArgP/LysG family DNA-binding transcriptional regulator [uncultured Jannaschia sp.]|uniref:ArgP/LysG family DNA-binding transcriptional regulator n=1 Tax=uncultured Jannaschia sp. TaxID=293347 RepID=UPI00261895BD|nr:ArgP/LysG family DNA-binding transcriptional regulator [uncultured Jannaschia sp.]